MATISSPGIGSGLDIKSIVSQLVALEKAPLTALDVKTATIQTKISAFGQIKSLVSPLSDAASALNSLTTWNAVATSSTNSKAVTASAIGGTAATTFSVEVQALAKPQDTASAPLLPVGGAVGAGTLTLTLGKWTPPVVAPPSPASFAPGTATPVNLTISVSDKLTDVASKINSANAGVTATVLTDASGERLLLRSQATGEDNGFQLSVADADTNNTDALGLSRLTVGSTVTQYGGNAAATVNGIPVTSATNTFSNVVSGVSLTVGEVTTTAATVTVSKNTAAINSAIDGFVKAYNTLNDSLNELTKYDPANKSAGILQGDSTAVGLQNAMRGILQSMTSGAGGLTRLADIGITQLQGGNLSVDSSKLSSALETKLDDVKNLFKADNSNALTNGVALKFKSFATGLLATDGFFKSKDESLKRTLDANAKDKARLNEKVARVEAALNRRYSALDAQVASLNALNSYITQQVTTWNKSTS